MVATVPWLRHKQCYSSLVVETVSFLVLFEYKIGDT